MPKKKKEELSESNKVEKKSITKKTNKKEKETKIITAPGLEITNTDIEDVKRFLEDEKKILEDISKHGVNEDEFIGEKKPTKSKKKYYTDAHSTWDCDRIILRINGKDYIRQFPSVVSIGKDKLGKKTVYGKNADRTNKWGKITAIIEENNDLVFEITPIEV